MKLLLQKKLPAGDFSFSPAELVQGRERSFYMWKALDALVLKAIALVLQKHLSPYLYFSTPKPFFLEKSILGNLLSPASCLPFPVNIDPCCLQYIKFQHMRLVRGQ